MPEVAVVRCEGGRGGEASQATASISQRERGTPQPKIRHRVRRRVQCRRHAKGALKGVGRLGRREEGERESLLRRASVRRGLRGLTREPLDDQVVWGAARLVPLEKVREGRCVAAVDEDAVEAERGA